jgi:serine/threonine protein kinase
MNLHSGNILIDNEIIKILDIENFVNDLPIKNEAYFNYVFSNFNRETIKSDNSILTDVFTSNYNVFEKIDIISFGRIMYEMAFGKELKAPYPDDIEYNDLDPTLSDLLRIIFVKKYSKMNSNSIITVPEVSAADLLRHKLFNNESLLGIIFLK